MSITWFEGAAGTGKTTELFAELSRQLEIRPLREDQRVLTLTYYHGARQRLHARLQKMDTLAGRFTCQTVDSFARGLVIRWRAAFDCLFPDEPVIADRSFDQICANAAALLRRPDVLAWVTRAYPVVLVDEMQDLKAGRLEIVQMLSTDAIVLAAADGFQDLNGDEGDNPAVAWLSSEAQCNALSKCHRTNVDALKEAATQVRCRQAVTVNEKRVFEVCSAPTVDLAATIACLALLGSPKGSNLAIVSAARASNSRFVRDVLERLQGRPGPPICKGRNLPVFRLVWEGAAEEEEDAALGTLALPDDNAALVGVESLRATTAHWAAAELVRVLEHRRALTGNSEFPVAVVRDELKRIVQAKRAFCLTSSVGIRAMTVHTAKNREFDGVIVLWPFRVPPLAETRRRWLYNAITRARRWVRVIVEDPNRKRTRLNEAPFSANA